METSDSEGWLSVSLGLGEVEVVSEVVQIFISGGVIIVMMVDSTQVRLSMGRVIEMDGMDVVVVLEVLENLGGGWLWLQKEYMVVKKFEEE